MFTSRQILRVSVGLSVLVLAAGNGCLHRKKNAKPKESSAIASEVEADFKRRFMEKRVGELTARGATPEAAQTQANEEFRARYGATHAAGK